MSLFHWRATFKKDIETWEMLGSVPGMICYVCHLINRHGEIMGEGRGARNTRSDNNDPNKTIKMAAKSAMIDAIMRTGALSDAFTQDLEDMPPVVKTISHHPMQAIAKPTSQTPQNKYPQPMGRSVVYDDPPVPATEYDYYADYAAYEPKQEEKITPLPATPRFQLSQVNCHACAEPISQKVLEYSKSRYGKPLCMNCQKINVPIK